MSLLDVSSLDLLYQLNILRYRTHHHTNKEGVRKATEKLTAIPWRLQENKEKPIYFLFPFFGLILTWKYNTNNSKTK